MGDVDIVIDLDAGKGPFARRKGVPGRIHATARHAETGIGIGGFGIVDAGGPEDVAGAVQDRLICRFATVDLQVGPAVLHFGQGLKLIIGEPHAAIGTATIDAKVISRHERHLRGGGTWPAGRICGQSQIRGSIRRGP